MSNFLVRTISATVYASLVVSAILVHPYYYGVVFMALCLLTVRELMHLRQMSVLQTTIAMVLAAILFVAYYLYGGLASWLLLAYNALLVVSLVIELFAKADNPVHNWGTILMSQAMVALPFSMMNSIMGDCKYLLLALFVLIWVNDSGAYIIGSLMGKRAGGNHKMFPRVSPNKSWEGLIGGALFAILGGWVLYRVGWFDCMHGRHALRFAMIYAVLISMFGTLGDLMESLFKRTLGIKDSGNLMPGHGGALDRFDSLLLATPVVYLLLIYWPL